MLENSHGSPTVLVILDGFGYSDKKEGNAIARAKMPYWHFLLDRFPHTYLHASGEHVGLLPGVIGNSEVGHFTIGAGRVVDSMIRRFITSIDDGTFFQHEQLKIQLNKLKKSGGRLHLMGLVSDGGVHSHEKCLYALIKVAQAQGIHEIYIHAFLDGRDVPPKSAESYLNRLQQVCDSTGIVRIASIHGRFYAMDRDDNWNRTNKTYDVLFGVHMPDAENSWKEVLHEQYGQGITDEFIVPTCLLSQGVIQSHDGVIFFNVRPDRARQLTECFVLPDFCFFKREGVGTFDKGLTFFITAVPYKDAYLDYGCDVLFFEEKVYDTLLDVIAHKSDHNHVTIVAETEKSAHVTYFFKGQREEHFANEQWRIVPSIKTSSYATCPEMSAQEITNKVLKALRTQYGLFCLVNYANADMVGHTGDFAATVKACEFLDKQLGILYKEVVENAGGVLFITADHGNAEAMIDLNTHQPLTAHTCNKVPFLTVGASSQLHVGEDDGICCVAPTILTYLGIDIPSGMICRSLL